MFRFFAFFTFTLIASFSFSQNKILESDEDKLNAFIDRWHDWAKSANLESYFDAMSEDFIFLGTDPSERWTKQEFFTFCAPYFKKKETWDFKKAQRYWAINVSENTLWFDEVIDTWMGNCRGVGVLVKEKEDWKIAFYNLSVLIENDKIQKFIDLRNHD